MIEGKDSWVVPPWYPGEEDYDPFEDHDPYDSGEFHPPGQPKTTVDVKEEYL